jgi:hypothetical protein
LPTHLRLALPSGLFPSGSPTKILYAFIFSPCVLHALPILSLTWSLHLAKSYEASHYAVFSNLLSLHLSPVQIFSSTPSSLCSSLNVRDQEIPVIINTT